jgi:sugar phosphate isomerase/epimerase
VAKRQFGVSTHLYHNQRLGREHLLEIAAHGFEAVEVFATRTHFDYHNPAAVADLQQWLAEAGLELSSIHAPIGEAYQGGRWSGMFSLASADGEARARAVAETEHALHIARRIPVRVLVAHLGLPRGTGVAGRESDARPPDSRAAARRSIGELQRTAEPLGVRVAVEVIPNELSRARSLVHFIEEELEGFDVGLCLDTGHAHIDGDLVEAIETVAEHLVTTDVHDNRGRNDDHLVPFEGSVDWPSALTALQKVGYEGPVLFEIGAQGSTKETLKKAQKARDRIERLLQD